MPDMQSLIDLLFPALPDDFGKAATVLYLITHWLLLIQSAIVAHWGAVLFWLFIWNGVVFMIYGIDKVRAEDGEWRISERRLHRLARWGGIFGALLACHVFRHKIRKARFYQPLRDIMWGQFMLLSVLVIYLHFVTPNVA